MAYLNIFSLCMVLVLVVAIVTLDYRTTKLEHGIDAAISSVVRE